MSSIFGGYEPLIYTSDGGTKNNGAFTNRGVATRINPILDPGNIEIDGSGRRGLYDILLGMREPQFTLDMLFTDKTFISTFQDGLTAPPWLHYRIPGTPDSGLTFEAPKINRVSVEARHNEAIMATIEFWAKAVSAIAIPGSGWPGVVSTPYRWSDSDLTIGILQTDWWSWRYEVNNNLQRLGNVADGGTRDIKARNRRVTGTIIKDCSSYAEYIALADLGSEAAKFNITIEVDSLPLLNVDCRWGRLEAPSGPTDLIAKRFPFVAKDLT